jgi:hypothetical protein
MCLQGLTHPISASDVVIQPGDVLLLSTSTTWAEEHKYDRNFLMIDDVSEPNCRCMVSCRLIM